MIKVVKIGGNVVDNPELLREFIRDFAAMPGMKVLIHGGGVMASQMQKSMGMTPGVKFTHSSPFSFADS